MTDSDRTVASRLSAAPPTLSYVSPARTTPPVERRAILAESGFDSGRRRLTSGRTTTGRRAGDRGQKRGRSSCGVTFGGVKHSRPWRSGAPSSPHVLHDVAEVPHDRVPVVVRRLLVAAREPDEAEPELLRDLLVVVGVADHQHPPWFVA
jgi:hypothetical protein